MPGAREGTTHIVRRALVAPWPSMTMRFGLALVAWLPLVALTVGLTRGIPDEPMALVFMATSFVLLVILPRVAYVAALATLLALLVGSVFVAGIFLSGGAPPFERLSLYVGGLLVVGYLATAAVVVIGPSTMRPWSAR